MMAPVTHSKASVPIRCEKLRVSGIVQGVGFRPFVYKSACELGLSGSVANTRDGVEIVVCGSEDVLFKFKERLVFHSPELCRITGMIAEQIPLTSLSGFHIEESRTGSDGGTLVAPDASLCRDCQAELLEPSNRRYAYPFTNCTSCGPRFTIVRSLPFDRKRTAMDSFPMCPLCRIEYDDPCDRRFHAQATCCSSCGPQVWLVQSSGGHVHGNEAITSAVSLIKKGMIVAVKGLGGFHLAVNALDNGAVSRLRKLKDRGDKPFAVMASSLANVREFAEVSVDEAEHLGSSARPVVILNKRHPDGGGYPVAWDVAPSNPMIGAMLPYTPLHVLLFKAGLDVLVMTSANRKNDPIVCDNDQAIATLGDMADGFLLHDRDIHIRSDDSVGRWIDGRFRLFRRSRGYVPAPVAMAADTADIFAAGGVKKNTLCVVKGGSAFISPHIGDLESPEGFGFFHETAEHMTALFDVRPEIAVHDLHPDYVHRDYGKAFPGALIIPVQHHHAHIVSCMVENGWDKDVIGFAFDGTGYGDDGAIWGGEVLVASREGYRRCAHIGYVPMPGGAAAVKEPWRMGISWLYHAFGQDMWNLDVPLLAVAGKGSDPGDGKVLVRMMTRSVNSPLTSSMGRLFDAVAAIMGLCRVNTYDGQGAITVEMCAAHQEYEAYGIEMTVDDNGSMDMRPLIRALVRDLESGVDHAVISARFHETLIVYFAETGRKLADQTGINVAALSGGVFQNARLLSGLSRALQKQGFTVLTHASVPSNDGGLSLGQAGIARALSGRRKTHGI